MSPQEKTGTRTKTSGKPPATEGKDLAGLAILVVDDTKANIDLIAALLAPRAEVVACFQPTKVLEVFSRLPFDAVIVDMAMQPMDGFEVAKAIRAQEAGKSVPILMVSAVVTEPPPDRLADAGIDEFLPMPFELTALMPILERLVNSKKARSEG